VILFRRGLEERRIRNNFYEANPVSRVYCRRTRVVSDELGWSDRFYSPEELGGSPGADSWGARDCLLVDSNVPCSETVASSFQVLLVV
jgi:hypothetical protein